MNGLREDRLTAVIDRFYEIAAQPGSWRTVLAEYADAVGADGAVLLPGPPVPRGAEAADGAAAFGWRIDGPNGQRSETHAVRVFTAAGPAETGPQDLDDADGHRVTTGGDGIDRPGNGWFAAIYLVPAARQSIMLSAARRRDRGSFSRREVERIELAIPHLQRAGQMAVRLAETRAEGVLEAFEMMRCGGMLLDATGAVIRMNARARSNLGRGLMVARGAVFTQHGPTNAALSRLIGSVLYQGPPGGAPPREAVAIPRQEGSPLVVHAAPLLPVNHDVFQRARATLMVTDPDEEGPTGGALMRQAYGLTAAEARLTDALERGFDLGEIAASHGVTVATLRSQLKAVFSKTGTNRQAELVNLLGRLSGQLR